MRTHAEAMERWQRRPESIGRPRKTAWDLGTSPPWGYFMGEDLTGLMPEARAARKIELVRAAIGRDRYNHFLKKKLRRMERTHAERLILGYEWLAANPSHPSSPWHNDYLTRAPF